MPSLSKLLFFRPYFFTSLALIIIPSEDVGGEMFRFCPVWQDIDILYTRKAEQLSALNQSKPAWAT